MSSQPTASEETALSRREEFSTELAPTAQAEAARQEVQAAVVLAKKFPRNEDDAYAKIIKACKRASFAGDVEYSFPRGGKDVTGASIYLAREFARVWGNIRHGCDVISDSDGERTIRAWAWDLETNVKVTADATFKKLIQRKRNNETVWVAPDERDLRELTNKHAALAKRNCLLELLPSDMVEDCQIQSRKTLKNKAAENPDEARKALIVAFGDLSVPVAKLETYLGHPIGESSPDEIVKLRAIYKSIKDGNSTWSDYMAQTPEGRADELAQRTKQNAADLRDKVAPKETAPADNTEPIVGEVVSTPNNRPADTDEDAERSAIEAEATPIDEKESKRQTLIQAVKDVAMESVQGDTEAYANLVKGISFEKATMGQLKDHLQSFKAA